MGFKQIIANTSPLSTDVDQFRQALSGTADVGALSLCAAQSTPIVSTVAPTGVGNLNGTYYYKVALITGFQQSDGSYYVNGFVSSTDSAQLTVANGQCALTNIPLGSAGTIGRAIYRTIAGGSTGIEKFAFVIWDNVTVSFNDNVLDGILGTGMPNSSSVPAAYCTAIPSTPPGTNTTGTTIAIPGVLTAANIDVTVPSETSFNAHLADYVQDTGVANAYVMTLVPILTSYVPGRMYKFNALNTNTGASTLKINTLGVIPIKKNINLDLVAGDIQSGQIVTVIFDGTNFQFVGVTQLERTNWTNKVDPASIAVPIVTVPGGIDFNTSSWTFTVVGATSDSLNTYPVEGFGGQITQVNNGYFRNQYAVAGWGSSNVWYRSINAGLQFNVNGDGSKWKRLINADSNGNVAIVGALTIGGYNAANALSGGWKIQSGTVGTPGTVGSTINTTVTFPTAFSSTPIVTLTPKNTSSSVPLGINTTTAYPFSVYNVTTTGFILESNQNSTITYNWEAIGS